MASQITKDSICAPSEDVVAREIEGDIIIVPLVSGIGNADDELYTLNETGKAIWRKLDGERTLGQIAGILAEEFSASIEEIDLDVQGFAAEMIRLGILAIRK